MSNVILITGAGTGPALDGRGDHAVDVDGGHFCGRWGGTRMTARPEEAAASIGRSPRQPDEAVGLFLGLR